MNFDHTSPERSYRLTKLSLADTWSGTSQNIFTIYTPFSCIQNYIEYNSENKVNMHMCKTCGTGWVIRALNDYFPIRKA
jgi:hypothetical protein